MHIAYLIGFLVFCLQLKCISTKLSCVVGYLSQMALSLSSSHVRAGLRPSSTQRQLTKPLPPPRAGMGDAAKDIADAVVQNFSKPKVGVSAYLQYLMLSGVFLLKY